MYFQIPEIARLNWGTSTNQMSLLHDLCSFKHLMLFILLIAYFLPELCSMLCNLSAVVCWSVWMFFAYLLLFKIYLNLHTILLWVCVLSKICYLFSYVSAIVFRNVSAFLFYLIGKTLKLKVVFRVLILFLHFVYSFITECIVSFDIFQVVCVLTGHF